MGKAALIGAGIGAGIGIGLGLAAGVMMKLWTVVRSQRLPVACWVQLALESAHLWEAWEADKGKYSFTRVTRRVLSSPCTNVCGGGGPCLVRTRLVRGNTSPHPLGEGRDENERPRPPSVVPIGGVIHGSLCVILQVADLDQAADFYSKLLADPGRRIPYVSRHDFDCGPSQTGLVYRSVDNQPPKPLPYFIYFSVNDLEEFHVRATALNCLAEAGVHGAASGDIVVRPWGERSFYVNDPWCNGLCFVDSQTLFTGR